MKLNPKTVAVVGGLSLKSYSAMFGACSPVRLEMRRCGLEHHLPEPPPAHLDGTLNHAVERAQRQAGRMERAKRMARDWNDAEASDGGAA